MARVKSTGNLDDTDTLVETLLNRAGKARKERKAMMIQPQSKQEKMVNQLCSYLSTQLIQVKPELSFDFTMDWKRLLHTNGTQSEQLPSPSSGV